jgi:O-antigen/teichoic acid export membrane protein
VAELGDRSRRIARYYAPLLGKSIGSQLVDKFGLFVIAGTLPLAVAGAYAAVMPLAAFSIIFARWTYGPLATHFAERHGVGDQDGAARLLWGSTSLFAVTSCLIALVLASVGPTVIRLLFSAQYLVASDAFAVLLLATAIGGVGGPAVRALLAAHRTGTVAAISLSTGVLSVGVAYLAARRFGMIGVASTTAAMLAIQAVAYIAWATVGERERARYAWLGAPFAAAAGLYMASRALAPAPGVLQQAAAAALGGAIYLVTMAKLTPMLSLAEIARLARAAFPALFSSGGSDG